MAVTEKKRTETYRVALKEKRGGLRFPITQRDFNNYPEAEAYWEDLVLDNEKHGIKLGKIVELQHYDVNQRCSTLKEKHI